MWLGGDHVHIVEWIGKTYCIEALNHNRKEFEEDDDYYYFITIITTTITIIIQ